MSSEHRIENREQQEHNQANLESVRAERIEELRHNPETTPDNAHERAEDARKIINKTEHTPEPVSQTEKEVTASKPNLLFLDHKLNYVQTLASVQRRLNPVSRTFSMVIHAPAVEKTSELLEKTIARPSISVSATWTALVIGSIFYFTARHYGYELSGSELSLSFVVGAIIGIVLEGLWRIMQRRRMR
jgi:uncharacterized protein (DUF849 family)